MTAREQLVAYLATLIALIVALLGAMLISAWVPAVLGKIEVFALGTVFGGLIGVLRIPSQRTPVATTDKGDVIRPHAAQVDAANARSDTAVAKATTALTQDAMGETLAVGNDHAAIDATTQENDRAIHAAPGAAVALDPALARAGRAALCLRRAYRDTPQCVAVPRDP